MGGEIDLRAGVLVDYVSLAEVGRFARFGGYCRTRFSWAQTNKRPTLERRIGSKVSRDILIDENRQIDNPAFRRNRSDVSGKSRRDFDARLRRLRATG